jgi:hypothetical protein
MIHRLKQGESVVTRLTAFAAGMLAVTLVFSRPAYPQSPSPEAAAAARELVEAARTTAQFKTLLPLMLQQMKPVVVQGRPEVERDYDRIVPLLMELANRQVGEFAEEVAALYARNFTVDEIQQVTAFYRSPVGQKFLEKTPVIAQESMVMGQKFGQRIVQDLQTRMRDELRKRGHNI